MSSSPTLPTRIREDVLRDPRYPVHKIADQLLPYIQVLVEQFHPEQIILFGSYAYGDPGPDSDVDLLVVKSIDKTPAADATSIRRAIRPLRHTVANLPFDIMVRAPDDFADRIQRGCALHVEIAHNGIQLLWTPTIGSFGEMVDLIEAAIATPPPPPPPPPPGE